MHYFYSFTGDIAHLEACSQVEIKVHFHLILHVLTLTSLKCRRVTYYATICLYIAVFHCIDGQLLSVNSI